MAISESPHTTGPELVIPDQVGQSVTPESAERFLNRELSWLDFNARVLALAEDQTQPVLERAKYLAIFSQNLDEFFQVRVSGLMEQIVAKVRGLSPDGLDANEQLSEIRSRVCELTARQNAVFRTQIVPELDAAGIEFVQAEMLDAADRTYLLDVFVEQIFPVLTPLAVDPAHPFPYISNLSLNLAVVVRDPESAEERFARVKVPPLLPRFIMLRDGQHAAPIEQVIALHLDHLFPGMEIVGHHPFRVTRDADFELDDDADDLLEAIEFVLRQRTKYGDVVRLEVDTTMTGSALDLLVRELDLSPSDVYVVDGLLDLGGLWALHALERPELKNSTWTPQTQPVLARTEPPPDFFRVLEAGDVLVHHPYDSFSTSVEAFIEQAARDPKVLAIKQTLYRTGGTTSRLVQSLRRAAESGKQVVVVVELQARFDEEGNIERARVLEKAGAHVVYGLVGLKTHAKIILVVRQEATGIRRYCHVGTGNYNPHTAHIYEDIGLFSADPDLGADLTELFNHLTGYGRQSKYRRLLVAPGGLRTALLEEISREAHPDGRILMKMNSLVDPAMIDALYRASEAGADIDLIVRGVCCLRPGLPGLSEGIRVRSILGRFLEHSRVFRFGADPSTNRYYFGSADLMPRNLDRRVEAVVPVTDPHLRSRIDEMLLLELADDVLAWELDPDGVWHKAPNVVNIDSQERLQALAVNRAHGIRTGETRLGAL